MIALVLATALAVTPEECIALRGTPAATAEYQGKTYKFTSAACRDEFLTDPARFSQLYDALLEMQAEGLEIAKPQESLVPS